MALPADTKNNKASALANALSSVRSNAASSTSGTSSTSSSTTAGATITANDFLTLLVSELKNQDPTAPTDPNAYITQMVDVNSLQQLININQGISTLDGGTSTTTGSAIGATAAASAVANAATGVTAATDPAAMIARSSGSTITTPTGS
jgi:flagellar basal-body rod modification protein FlgD